MNFKTSSFIFGALLAVFVFALSIHSTDLTFLGDLGLSASSKIILNHDTSQPWRKYGLVGPNRGTTFTDHRFTFTYPARLDINDTKPVELIYSKKKKVVSHGREFFDTSFSQLAEDGSFNVEPDSSWEEAWIGEKTLSLYSSGFDIAPSIKLITKKDAKSPLKFTWTITPKKEGEKQVLVLDIRDIINLSKDINERASLTLNGSVYNSDEDGLLKLELDVLTIWGVKRKTFEIVKNIIAFIGFVLMYPLLHDVIRHRFVKEPNNQINKDASR